MKGQLDRKAALRAYKERKPRPGIFAVRELATGRAWPGAAQNLDTVRNGLWLCLDQGRHLDKSLQQEWLRLGAAAFDFVVLEVLEDGMSSLVLTETLKAKVAEWAQVLGAEGPGDAR